LTAVLVELALRQLRGRLWRWLRLLRQPRYLVGTLLGVLYFGWFVLRPSRRVGVAGIAPWLEQHGDAVQVVGALALALAASLAWLLMAAKPKLPLTEVEVLTLAGAPLTRRQVLRYAVIKSQLGILFTVLILTLATAYAGRLHLLPAYWALLTLADLHFKAVGLTKAAFAAGPPARQRAAIAAGVCVLAVFWTVVLVEPAGLLLTPFRWVTSIFAGAGLPWIGVAVLLVAHDRWVVSSRVRFEEPALAHARKRERRQQSRQRSESRVVSSEARRQVPFPLHPQGRPEAAILWKNLMLAGRRPFRWLVLLIPGPPLAAAMAATLGIGPAYFHFVYFIGGAVFATAMVLGGMLYRQDLRTDLLHVGVLKSWPVHGWRLAVAEILTPVIRSLMMAVVGLAVAAAGAVGSGLAAGSLAAGILGGRMFELVALGFALLPLVLASAAYASSVQNLLAMTFPAWAVIDARSPQRGPAASGQKLLLGLGHMLAMLVGGVLPVLAGVAAFFVLRLLGRPFHVWELPFLALPAAVALLAQTSFLLAWVGKRWDDLDPAQELLDG